MHTSNEIEIRADLKTIFEMASRVEDWGRILPHYRYVEVLHRDGPRKWVRMSAWRDRIPVTWTAIETVVTPDEQQPGSIRFYHIRGMVRGMDVEWWFKARPERGDVLVGIRHELSKPRFPVSILGPRLTEKVVGDGFIGYIAGKTLRRIKELAEAQSTSNIQDGTAQRPLVGWERH